MFLRLEGVLGETGKNGSVFHLDDEQNIFFAIDVVVEVHLVVWVVAIDEFAFEDASPTFSFYGIPYELFVFGIVFKDFMLEESSQ